MQVQNDPLILVLDLEQLRLRSKEELLPLLENHILLIIMGQVRDIKERERLSRKLCREYNQFFEAHDIVVSPSPLSTTQTDARLIAPRKLAHLIGITTSDTLLRQATQNPVTPVTPEVSASPEQTASPSAWKRFTQMLRFALLLIAAVLPVFGLSESQSRSIIAPGRRARSLLLCGESTNLLCSLPTPRLCEQALTKDPDRRVVGPSLADSRVTVGQSASIRPARAKRNRSGNLVAPSPLRVSRALAQGSSVRLESSSEPFSGVSGFKREPVQIAAANWSRARFLRCDHSNKVHRERHGDSSSRKERSPQSAMQNAHLEAPRYRSGDAHV